MRRRSPSWCPAGEAAGAWAEGSHQQRREASERLGGGGAKLEERWGTGEGTPGRPEMGVEGAGEDAGAQGGS